MMQNESLVENWGAPAQSDPQEGDVSIQCIQSSEFVVGKQTNFNGPVTIISCTDAPESKNPVIENKRQNEEKIIIRDKVVSQPTMTSEKNQDEKKDGVRGGKQKIPHLSKILVIVFVGLLTAAATASTLLFITAPTPDHTNDINGTRFYSKQDWGGKPPKSTIRMKLPVPYVVVSHSVTPRCYDLKVCSIFIRNMQKYHFSEDYADISYNFLIDSSGNIYEGRGWHIRNVMGGFANGRNVDIGLIGDYSEDIHPSEELIAGLRFLLDFGIENDKISKMYSLIAANSTYATLSPGKNVYEVIKSWPHFDPNPKSHVKDFDER